LLPTSKHICELQLVHTQLYMIRKNMGAHASYAVFWAALELLKMLGEDPEEGGNPGELAAMVWTGESPVETGRGGGAKTEAFQAKLAKLEVLVSKLEAESEKREAEKVEMEGTFKAEVAELKSTFKAEVAELSTKMTIKEAQLDQFDLSISPS
jgi:hypothetical protein